MSSNIDAVSGSLNRYLDGERQAEIDEFIRVQDCKEQRDGALRDLLASSAAVDHALESLEDADYRELARLVAAGRHAECGMVLRGVAVRRFESLLDSIEDGSEDEATPRDLVRRLCAPPKKTTASLPAAGGAFSSRIAA